MFLFDSFLQKPKNVRFESQERKENLYFLLRRHPITNLGWMLFSILLIVFPLASMIYFTNAEIDTFKYLPSQYQLVLVILWYMLTMLYTFESFLIWYFNVYIITNKRVIDVDFRGFWGKRISEASLANIEDVTYETSKFFHIVFDYGSIFVQTAAEKTEFEFHSIPKPWLVHDKLTDLVEAYQRPRPQGQDMLKRSQSERYKNRTSK